MRNIGSGVEKKRCYAPPMIIQSDVILWTDDLVVKVEDYYFYLFYFILIIEGRNLYLISTYYTVSVGVYKHLGIGLIDENIGVAVLIWVWTVLTMGLND